MKRNVAVASLAVLGLAGAIVGAVPTAPAKVIPTTKAAIVPVMEKMADAQLAVYGEKPPSDWIAGAFYVGLTRLTHLSESPRFVEAEKKIAERYNWSFQSAKGPLAIAHADNECIGQMYIDLAVLTKDVGKLDAIKKQWDSVIPGFDDPTPANRQAWSSGTAPGTENLPWWWCDALFMAPPGMARLSVVTGDKKYIDAMDKQYWITTEKLYDKEEHLFFRDNRFPGQKSPNGKKVFWSRGNGWVYAGLANLLTYMPKEYPSRPKYETLFKEMAAKLAEIQQADGMWRGSLIDPASADFPETSGTGFFCFGTAWGINNGLLDRAKYEPVVSKAWAALNTHIRPDGLMGFVQKVGDRPAPATASDTVAYASGGFLLSAAEVIKLYEGK